MRGSFYCTGRSIRRAKANRSKYISEAALRTTEGNNATRWPDASVRPLNRYQIDDIVDD